MAVSRAEKEQELQDLSSAFKAADTAILVDYRGLNVPQATELRRQLRREGIESEPFYFPIHMQLPYMKARRRSLPVAEDLYGRGLLLPGSTLLANEELLRVAGGPSRDIRQFVSREELKALLAMEPGEAEVSTQEAEMIDKIFDLGDTTVREVMVPLVEVAMLPVTATPDEAVARDTLGTSPKRLPFVGR